MGRVSRANLLSVGVGIALATTACGGSSSPSSSATSASTTASAPGVFGAVRDPAIAATVPSTIRAKGALTVAADASYAPNEFIASNGSTVVGWDVDLGHAIGAVLGLRFNFVNASFDSIIPGLQSGKFDLGISSFYDTKAREKVVDFVTYYKDGSSFLARAGSRTITTLDQLCGLTVGVEAGTTELQDVTTQNAKCKAHGKPGVTVRAYPSQTDANLALTSGRAQVGDVDTVVGAYQVKISHGQLRMSGSYGVALYGIAVPKHTGMAKPIQAALLRLIRDGVYQRILAHWGVQQGALTNPAINAAAATP